MDRVQILARASWGVPNLSSQAISTTRNSDLPEKKCVISLNSVKLGCRFQGSQQHTSPGEHEQFIVSVQTNWAFTRWRSGQRAPSTQFVEAKQKVNAKFRDLKKYLEDCDKFLAEFRKADENERDIKKFSSKVRLYVAFKLHDVDENF